MAFQKPAPRTTQAGAFKNRRMNGPATPRAGPSTPLHGRRAGRVRRARAPAPRTGPAHTAPRNKH